MSEVWKMTICDVMLKFLNRILKKKEVKTWQEKKEFIGNLMERHLR